MGASEQSSVLWWSKRTLLSGCCCCWLGMPMSGTLRAIQVSTCTSSCCNWHRMLNLKMSGRREGWGVVCASVGVHLNASTLFERRRAWVPASQKQEDDRANEGWRRRMRSGLEGRHFHLRLCEEPKGTPNECGGPGICWRVIVSSIFCRQ